MRLAHVVYKICLLLVFLLVAFLALSLVFIPVGLLWLANLDPLQLTLFIVIWVPVTILISSTFYDSIVEPIVLKLKKGFFKWGR